MNRALRTLLLAALLSVTLVGCGGGPGGETSGEPSETPGAPTPQNPESEEDPSSSESENEDVAGDMTDFTLSIISTSASQWPVYVMQDRGMAAEHGLDLDVVVAGGSSNSIQQTLAGEANAGEAPVEQVVQLVSKDQTDARIIAGSQLYYSAAVVARDGIAAAADLKGARISVVSEANSTNYLTRAWLQDNGVAAEEWTPIFAAVNSASRYAALEANAVDAVILAAPLSMDAEEAGYTIVSELGEVFRDFAFTSFIATQAEIADNRDGLSRFAAAYADAIDWLYEPENEAAAQELLTAETGTSAEHAAALYELLVVDNDGFATGAVLPESSLEGVQQQLLAAGLIDEARPAGDFVAVLE